MKLQTYIAFYYNANGDKVDFDRFSCKRADTVKRQILRALEDSALFRTCHRLDGSARVAVFATPDGLTEEPAPRLEFSVSEIVNRA